jgi:hypothetical protein
VIGGGDVSGVWNGDEHFSKISLGVLASVDGDDSELGSKMSWSELESVASL